MDSVLTESASPPASNSTEKWRVMNGASGESMLMPPQSIWRGPRGMMGASSSSTTGKSPPLSVRKASMPSSVALARATKRPFISATTATMTATTTPMHKSTNFLRKPPDHAFASRE